MKRRKEEQLGVLLAKYIQSFPSPADQQINIGMRL